MLRDRINRDNNKIVVGGQVVSLAEEQIERRSFPRIPVQARMRVSHSKLGTLEGYSINVSDTGVFMRLANLPKVPRGAHIGLQMLDSANPGIIFNTRVIHSSESGLGVAIVDYELNGLRYTLDELRRQWHVTKTDVTTKPRVLRFATRT